MFLGDKVLSYNGYLRFGVQSNGDKMFSRDVLESHPLVFLQGNHNIKLMYRSSKLSGSGRYEVHFHEHNWINYNAPTEPVSRIMLMIGLQQVQHLLIRATEAADTTVAVLHGISLDVARPSSSGAPRQAVGVEQCHCPPEYSGTSCQDPGQGYYRHYKERYVESEIIIDLVGDSVPCQCNGRADRCKSDTGYCLQCRENTAGASCDICAPGYHGDPKAGVPCTPCQCPSSEKNFAQTCYRDQRNSLVCSCRDGYTGPTCERCAHGYYGDPAADEGECLPCTCNSYGSESDQCDVRSGQCYCVPGVTGRACDQCKPRHVLTNQRTCKNCNDGCVGTLLDTMDNIQDILHTIDLEDLDPAPMRKLTHYTNISSVLQQKVQSAQHCAAQVENFKEKENSVGSSAELTLLESSKLAQLAETQRQQAGDLQGEAESVVAEVSGLDRKIKDMILYLDNHGRGRGTGVSLTNALSSASESLSHILSQDFSEFDIKVRTEMSHARILLDTVEKLLYGEVEISSITEKTGSLDNVVNDLLQYLNEGMTNVRMADGLNMRNNRSFGYTLEKCGRIENILATDNQRVNGGNILVRDGDKLFLNARDYFQKIIDQFKHLQNKAKELEAREIGMSAVVEDYRTRYVLPCQANAVKLHKIAQKIKDMFDDKVGVNADQAIKAANAYKQIIDRLDEARVAASEALDAAIAAYKVADPPGDNNLRRKAQQLRILSEDLRQEAQGLWKNADDMIIQLNGMKLDLDKYKFNLDQNRKQIDILESEIHRHSYVSEYAREAKEVAKQALEESNAAKDRADEMINRIKQDLKQRANDLNSFSAEELGAIPRKISESKMILQNVEKQAAYLERRTVDLNQINSKVQLNLSKLRSQINQAKHVASSIQISITGDETLNGACLRSYDTEMSATTHNEISIIYGVEGPETDSPLVYLPSSKKLVMDDGREVFDFMALEMVDRKIRFMWNTGAGTAVITHKLRIETAYNLARQDDMWYKITAERIGNIGRLNVRKVRPLYERPEYQKWEVGESPPTSNILDVLPADRLWIGGAPNYYKSNDLRAKGELAGVLYQLSVDKKNVGLWNFATSLGCRETHSGVTDLVQEHSCHTFSGDGYATQDQIRNYDPRYYAVSMELRTFDQDALLVLVANHDNGQYLSVEMKAGKIVLVINYGKGGKLEFVTKQTYNSGQWVKLEAGRASRGGSETGVLRVTFNGLREDYVDSISALQTQELDLQTSKLYFGGVPPSFDFNSFPHLEAKSLLGSLRGITTSNPGSNSLMNPLYTEYGIINPYYGVIPSCENRILKMASFGGAGHMEVKSQGLRRNSSFGLTFTSQQSDGLLALSTFLGKPSGHLADFYSVSLVGGRLALNLASRRITTNTTYNDGQHHTLFVIRRAAQVTVYIDDIRVDDGSVRLVANQREIKAPSQGGLFIGGVPSVIKADVLSSNLAASAENFVGTIQDFAFIDDLTVRVVAMNEPVSFFNVAIGRERFE